MPEYLAPGVFVEEVSFRQRSIEGVSTSTTGFVGPTRFGPLRGEPELVTSFSDCERLYGGLDRLRFEDLGQASHNDLAHAVRAYFEEGGRRLYVARTFEPLDTVEPPALDGQGRWSDGRARWTSEASPPPGFRLEARHPGAAGNFTVTFIFRAGENILSEDPVDPTDPGGPTVPVLRGAGNWDVVLAETGAGPRVLWADRFFDDALMRTTFRLRSDDPDQDPPVGELTLDQVTQVRVLTVSVLVSPLGRFGDEQAWEGLTFHPSHPRSLASFFGDQPLRRTYALHHPLVFETGLDNGAAIAQALLEQPNRADTGSALDALEGIYASPPEDPSEAATTVVLQLAGGNDGNLPDAGEYEGDDGGADGLKSGLRALQDLEDVSIVAAPGSTRAFPGIDAEDRSDAIFRQLIAHCERMRYRVAILDSIEGQSLGEIRTLRGTIDTTRAALYYPWVRIFDPVTEREILQPPSGFMAGIYARTDTERGVHKAPANEVIRLAQGFEFLLDTAQQEVLNPLGINCLRFFEGRGFRVWGARTASSDPEWRYLNVRRYFAYLERSIDVGTQFAVFEPNGDVLWSIVRRTVEDFLFNEWKSNRLLGTRPEQAYFVRCDRTTMTQNDIDNGRLICLIGVAPLRPAEFVIFRIGQKTADARS